MYIYISHRHFVDSLEPAGGRGGSVTGVCLLPSSVSPLGGIWFASYTKFMLTTVCVAIA